MNKSNDMRDYLLSMLLLILFCPHYLDAQVNFLNNNQYIDNSQNNNMIIESYIPKSFSQQLNPYIYKSEESSLFFDNYKSMRISKLWSGSILDSIYDYREGVLRKLVLTYNENYLITKEVVSQFDSIKLKWINGFVTNREYLDNGSIVLNESLEWSAARNQWINHNKQCFTYNEQSKIIKYVDYQGNSVNDRLSKHKRIDFMYVDGVEVRLNYYNNNEEWIKNDSIIIKLNVNNQLESYCVYGFDTDCECYIGVSKNDFRYYTGGGLDLIYYYYWNTNMNQWRYKQKRKYYKDSNGYDSLYIVYDEVNSSTQWKKTFRTEFKRTYYGKILQMIDSYYDNTNHKWDKTYKEIYKYDSIGRNIYYADFLWNNLWEMYNNYKLSYQVTPNDSLVVFYGNNNGMFSPVVQYNFKFDSEFTSSMVVPTEMFKLYKYKLLANNEIYYDSNGVLSKPTYNQFYFYSPLDTGNVENKLPETKFIIYPNPTNNSLYLNFNSSTSVVISIFDITGRVVLSKNIYSGDAINVGQLSRGVYVYKVYIEDKLYVGKIIKN